MTKTMHKRGDEVLEKAWKTSAWEELRPFPFIRFTGEDLRLFLEPKIGKPLVVNSWGALMTRLLATGKYRQTNEFEPAKDPKSKGKKLRVYEVAF